MGAYIGLLISGISGPHVGTPPFLCFLVNSATFSHPKLEKPCLGHSKIQEALSGHVFFLLIVTGLTLPGSASGASAGAPGSRDPAEVDHGVARASAGAPGSAALPEFQTPPFLFPSPGKVALKYFKLLPILNSEFRSLEKVVLKS